MLLAAAALRDKITPRSATLPMPATKQQCHAALLALALLRARAAEAVPGDREAPVGSLSQLSVEGVLAPVAGVAPTLVAGGAALPLRVGWTVASTARGDEQLAYELIVGGVTSGKVAWRNTSSGVPLPAALQLSPDSEYSLAVRSYLRSGAGAPTAWANSSFSTGLYSEADWHGAAWIGAGRGGPDGDDAGAALNSASDSSNNLWFRKQFTLTAAPTAARLHVAHASFYKCKIGGGPKQQAAQFVDDHELGATTSWWTRLYYDSYDLGDLLRDGGAGDYVLTCMVGKGRYGEATANSVAGRVCRVGQHSHGPPCAPGIRVLLSIFDSDNARQPPPVIR